MFRFYQLARSELAGHCSCGMIASLALNEIANDPAVLEIDRQNAELSGHQVHPSDDD